jgi:anaerobic ribonucleoside-triphosphate reductase
MLLIGIFSSAKELSRDNMIRREIYKVAGEQLDLFRNISEADLVRTSEKRVKAIIDKVEIQKYHPQEMTDDESDYKKFLEEAVEEIASKLEKKKGTESKDSL